MINTKVHTLGKGLFVIAAGLTLAAGCGSGGDNNAANNAANNATTNNTATTETKNQTVRIGFSPNIVLPQPILLQNNEKYSALSKGLTYEFKSYPGGPGVIEALRAGIVDIGYSGVFPPLNAYSKAKDIVLLAGATTGGTELSVAKNSPIKTVKDLKGKTIGVNQLGSTVDAMVRFNLIEAGLNPEKDVRIQPIDPAEQAEALKHGDVQAVAAPAPWPSQVALSGSGRALLNWKQILDNGKYAAGVVFTTKKFAEANPELVEQYLAVHRAVTDKINADRTAGNADVLAAWSKVTKKTLSPEVSKAAFSTIEYGNETDAAGVQRMADLSFKVGISRQKADMSGFIWKK
ncbi:MAG TPA: aliphatic sulfonate ABC transporter substrate-binding protein [Abditibacteriaceae bacterium]